MAKQSLQRILYAEDEDDIRVIARIALEDIGGFQVKYCRTGLDVLSEAEAFNPDVLLLDVMMPEMDGMTTLREVRKLPNMKNISVIFMTAKLQVDEVAEYEAAGVLGVIHKPFDPMKLAQNITDLWNKKIG